MICRLVVPPQSFEHFDVISVVDKSTDHGKLLLICLFVCFDFFTISLKVLTSISVEVSRRIASAMLCRLVVPQQSFKHFDVISMVDKSTDHGKLLLTCVLVCFVLFFFSKCHCKFSLTSISVSRRIASARSERKKQIAPP